MDLDAVAALPLCRRTIVELAQGLPAELPLLELAHARREKAFVNLVLAAAQAERAVPAEVLVPGASLLDDPLYLGAVMSRMQGDVGAAAVAAMDDGRVTTPWIAACLLFYTVVWCQRETRAVPAGVIRWARTTARRAIEDDTLVTCAAIGRLTADEGLKELTAGLDGPEWVELAAETTDWLLAAFVAEPASVVPELAPAVRRLGPKIGRNDACPCGSGKKYKRCCAGKPLAAAPVVSSRTDLEGLAPAELLALPIASLPIDLRVLAVWMVAELGEVEAALERVGSLPDEHAVEIFEFLAVARLGVGDVAGAKAILARMPPTDDLLPALAVATATPAKAVKALEAYALAALDGSGVDVAHAALLSPFPGLGILVARGVIADPEVSDDEALQLLAMLHEQRDALGLPPWDAASMWRQPAEGGARVAVDRHELEQVRTELQSHSAARREAEAAYARTERERARLESEAVRAKQAAAQAARPSDGHEVLALRAELAALKGMHKSVHDERNALRREVAAWRAQAEEEAVEPEAVEVEEADEADAVTAPSGLRAPELPEAFMEGLRRLPSATGRAAMARLGELCSGRPTGWRETKPLQGFENVWRVKIGRSYRMLFRVHEGRIEVLDIVHRQDLEKRLHQLQALR